VLAFLALMSTACNDANDVGDELLGTPSALYTDTVGFSLETRRVDSVITFGPLAYFAGQMDDPLTGTYTASFFQQFELGGDNINFGDNLQLDSITLDLILGSYFGNADARTQFEVYELAEALSVESEYTSNSDAAVTGPELSGGFTFGEVDTLINTVEGRDTLSIRLSDELGRRLLTLSPDQLSNDDAFVEVFRGLNVRATREPGSAAPGAIWVFDLLSPGSGITLHYTEQVDTGTVAQTYTFRAFSTSPGFNRYQRTNLAGTLLDQQTQLPAKPTRDSEWREL